MERLADKYNSWISSQDVTSLKKEQEEESMTFSPTSSFYVTLMSHASTREFPGKRSYHFKNRLPKPIRFVGRGWQVGMVSLSLPTIPPIGQPFVNEKDPLLFVRWHERVYVKDDQDNDRWWHQCPR